jgi:transposase
VFIFLSKGITPRISSKTKFSIRTVVEVDPGKHSIVYLTTDKGDGIPDKFTKRDIKYLKDEVEMKKDNRALRRCPNVDCGVLFSRDYNAAINIARQGRHLQERGEPDPWFRRPKKNEQSSPNAGRASTSSRGCA